MEDYEYDAKSRLKRERLPEVPAFGRPSLCYEYDGLDGLLSVKLELDAPESTSGCTLDGDACECSASATVLEQVSRRDAFGRVTRVLRGDGRTLSTFYHTDKFTYGYPQETMVTGGGLDDFRIVTEWQSARLHEKTLWDGVTSATAAYVYENEQLKEVLGDTAQVFGSPGPLGVLIESPEQGSITASADGLRVESATAVGSLTWDAAGYLKEDDTRVYHFDDHGRPTHIDSKDASFTPPTFTYNADGTRVGVDDTVHTLTRAGRFLVQESSAATAYRFDLGSALYTVKWDGTGWTVELDYVVADQVGSVLQRGDERASMPAFGAAASWPDDDVLVQPGYAGHSSMMVAGGLIDMKARLYDPGLGIFISPDPMIGDVLNPLAYNAYQYAYNNPGTYTDPTGEFVAVLAGAALGAAAGAFATHHAMDGYAGGRDYLAGALFGGTVGSISGGSISAGVTSTAASVAGSNVKAVAWLSATVKTNPLTVAVASGAVGGGPGAGWSTHKAAQDGVISRFSDWMRSLPTGSELANAWDELAAETSSVLEDFVQDRGGAGNVVGATLLQSSIDLGAGTINVLRLGEGFAKGGFWGFAEDSLRLMSVGTGGRAPRINLLRGVGCFPGDTLVATDRGLVAIEDVVAGDFVYCAQTSGTTPEWSLCEVASLISYEHSGDEADVYVGGEMFTATADHPFWVVSGRDLELRPVASDAHLERLGEAGRWVEAQDLIEGDYLALLSGEVVALDRVSLRSDRLPVFNLTVAQNKSFAFGQRGILVHNSAPKGGATLGQLKTALRTAGEAYKGTTRLGHALSKHAGRNPGLWGKVTGNASKWHGQAMKHFRSIYDAPGKFQRVTNDKGVTFLEKWHNGRGIRLNQDWTFKGFLD